jgi:Ca2+-binding EF-hand superfamily protein
MTPDNSMERHTFMRIYSHMGIKTSLQEEQQMLSFLASSDSRFQIDFIKLDQITAVFSKRYFSALSFQPGSEAVDLADQIFAFERVQQSLQSEFKVAEQAFRFFDLDQNGKVKVDQFLFGLKFFNVDLSIQQIKMIFDLADF